MIKSLLTIALLLAANQPADDLNRIANFGHIAFKKGDFSAAAAWYEQARSLAPDSPEATFDLALTWYRRGSYELAVRYLETAQSTAQGTLLARCLLLRADLEYRTALKLNPIQQVEGMEKALKLYRFALNETAPGPQADLVRYDIEVVKLRLPPARDKAPNMQSPQAQEEPSAEEISKGSREPQSKNPNQSKSEDRDW